MVSVLDSENVQGLSGLIEESTRSSKEGARFFLEPANNTLTRAAAKRHHIIFGRRGSGKSSLLTKVLVDAQADRRPIVYIDMEAFKGHSYPDVLVSVLLSTFQEFEKWIGGVAVEPGSKKGFWRSLIGKLPTRGPIKHTQLSAVAAEISQVIKDLKQLLHTADETQRQSVREIQAVSRHGRAAAGRLGSDASNVSVESSSGGEKGYKTTLQDEYVHEKVAYLHREILHFRDIMKRIAEVGQSHGYILLDDLYHIRSEDQVNVVDYFHRIAKGTSVWLKIGTIRHRTSYYTPGDPPKGMKIGDDCEEIDLDVTLERYQLTKSFLMKILEQFARECQVSVPAIVTDGARDRLVIGSGGVARDFLTIFRRSIDIARERYKAGDRARGDKIGAEDVNRAAGENDNYKQSEFGRDADAEKQETLRMFFHNLVQFCVSDVKTNCFLVEKDLQST